jgi:hypothetical protein
MKMPAATAGFKIENIAVLKPRFEREKYPFDQLKVGQSFFIGAAHSGDMPSVRVAAFAVQKRTGCKFSIVKEGTGWRCGRVK